jgi:hypothetical protein
MNLRPAHPSLLTKRDRDGRRPALHECMCTQSGAASLRRPLPSMDGGSVRGGAIVRSKCAMIPTVAWLGAIACSLITAVADASETTAESGPRTATGPSTASGVVHMVFDVSRVHPFASQIAAHRIPMPRRRFVSVQTH